MRRKLNRITARILATECIVTPAIASTLFIGVANATACCLHLERVRRLDEVELLLEAEWDDDFEDRIDGFADDPVRELLLTLCALPRRDEECGRWIGCETLSVRCGLIALDVR